MKNFEADETRPEIHSRGSQHERERHMRARLGKKEVKKNREKGRRERERERDLERKEWPSRARTGGGPK